ncbi:MAG: Zn-dependent oligopeptidase [Phycisphaerales bacterium]|nr:Zn-dependent oligopeptidase [Phycisphaerales bacterium]MCI0675535.1 Zn-dependent oligopeptidase [Phycisphaerales bacterium]
MHQIQLARRSSGKFVATLIMALVAALVGAPAHGFEIDPSSPIAQQLIAAEAAVAKIISIPDNQRTFENTVGALDDLVTRLQTDTSMTGFMAHVSTDAQERDKGLRAQEEVANWLIDLQQREELYRAVKHFEPQLGKLQGEQKRLLEFWLRDFRRAGMALEPEKRAELKTIQKEINKLGLEFDKNIADDATSVPLTAEELAGMPDDLMKQLEEVRSGDVYLVPMNPPTFEAILDNCRNETTRKKCWLAWKRRGGLENVRLLERIIKLRAQAATMLGYPTTAAYEIEVRMAKNPAAVDAFYEKLRPLIREKAQRDYDEYLAAKKAFTKDQNTQLYPWDQAFYEKQLKQSKYAVDSNKVKEYFPLQRVIDGLFSITQSLYGLEYKEVTAQAASLGKPLWHSDARLFEVWDKASKQKLGEFYIDLFPRPNKYSHAAQWGLADHKVYSDGTVQKPVAALVCNFNPPSKDQPSLLTHDQVETFFHEFGHCLHTIVSEVRYGYFAGANVERDLVEAPSQMFENWVWDADVLKTFARHYKTNEPLPDALLQGMVKARYLGSGLFAEHQFYYGLVDLAYHTAPGGEVDTTKVGLALFEEVELYDAVPQSYYQASFGHLVGYQAGYYSYQWSLVYAQDMFQRFKELGMLDPEAGMYYRKKILARGGTLDGMDLVKDYLGREPKMDAYLEHLGLKSGPD